MLRRWVSTVFSERNSSPAIARLVWRSADELGDLALALGELLEAGAAARAAGARAARHAVPEPAQLLRRLLARAARAGGVERGLGGGELARGGLGRRRARPARGRRAAARARRRGAAPIGSAAATAPRAPPPARPAASPAPAGRPRRRAPPARPARRARARPPSGAARAAHSAASSRRAAAQRTSRELLPHRGALRRHDARRLRPADRVEQQRAARARARRRRSARAPSVQPGSAGESSVGLSSRASVAAPPRRRICAARVLAGEQRDPAALPERPDEVLRVARAARDLERLVGQRRSPPACGRARAGRAPGRAASARSGRRARRRARSRCRGAGARRPALEALEVELGPAEVPERGEVVGELGVAQRRPAAPRPRSSCARAAATSPAGGRRRA